MDLRETPEDIAFRQQVRGFIAEALSPAVREKIKGDHHLDKQDFVDWQKALYRKGWIAPHWPVEFGGTGWTPTQRHIFEEELAYGHCPRIIPFGLKMVAPVIMKFGSQAQKDHYLPRILASEDWWCQGYSEPGSGSDLASLQTKAVRDGDHYVVNGMKTWTTMAQHADMIFCLVRTSSAGKQQEGISFLLIDMHSPGVSVRPIKTIDGSAEVNETRFDDVRVPVANLVGEENKGWTYAKYLLGHERTGIAGVAHSKEQIKRLKTIAGAERAGDRSLLETPRFRDKISTVEINLMALEMTELRTVYAESAGRAPGPEASILKIRGTEIQQAITELLFEAVGHYAFPVDDEREGANEPPIGPDYAGRLAPHYFNWRKSSIYGGSNEIQKNIIAKLVLGL
jgi:alkylation response protein AidB-like acyl-CoA dehydrogenase